ncbi:hypothetical protein E2C01_065837 [Portunus trituberculatus]|uniref:Uncharacterized protein n=1 Tax=Portunus trituberculatus TaxID=210409 RepID=A0A5B7HPE0_PORTR|nr:hypothetical protein [Portunus trituberculatus]
MRSFTSVPSSSSAVVSEDKDELPRFIEDVPNITVTVGRDALLPCTVEQLKGYKILLDFSRSKQLIPPLQPFKVQSLLSKCRKV